MHYKKINNNNSELFFYYKKIVFIYIIIWEYQLISMPRCPRCGHDFIAPRRDVDHWIDPFQLRASINCPSCRGSFEVWAGELSPN